VTLSLTHDEALVLFEWLHSNEGKHAFSDQSEQRVLWELEAFAEDVRNRIGSRSYVSWANRHPPP
jgi:hypothetical protein